MVGELSFNFRSRAGVDADGDRRSLNRRGSSCRFGLACFPGFRLEGKRSRFQALQSTLERIIRVAVRVNLTVPFLIYCGINGGGRRSSDGFSFGMFCRFLLALFHTKVFYTLGENFQNLFRAETAPLSAFETQIGKSQLPYGHAQQAQGGMSHMSRHSPHLPILSLPESQL